MISPQGHREHFVSTQCSGETYYSSTLTGFVVIKADDTNHMFKPSKNGLFFFDFKHDIAFIVKTQ